VLGFATSGPQTLIPAQGQGVHYGCIRYATPAVAVLSTVIVVFSGVPSAAQDPTALNRLIQIKTDFQKAFDSGNYPTAEKLARDMVSMLERAFPNQPEMTAAAMSNLGAVYEAQFKFRDAAQVQEYIAKTMESQAKSNPYALAVALNNVATTYVRLGRVDDAEKLLRRSIVLAEAGRLPEFPTIAKLRYNLASLLMGKGKLAEAETLDRKAIAAIEQAKAADSADMHECLLTLASIYDQTQRGGQAELTYKRVIASQEKQLGPQSIQVARSQTTLLSHYLAHNRTELARPVLEKAVATKVKILGLAHPETAYLAGMLAVMYVLDERLDEADRLLAQCRSAMRQAPEVDTSDLYLMSAIVALKRLDFSRAQELLAEQLAALERHYGPDSQQLVPALCMLAHIGTSLPTGKVEDARQRIERAIKIAKRHPLNAADQMQLDSVHANLLWKLGQRKDAVERLESVIAYNLARRKSSAGAEFDMTQMFDPHNNPFERMVAWQFNLGNAAQMFRTGELLRSRTLLDQMELANVDLLTGVPAGERSRLKQRLTSAQRRLQLLDNQIAGASSLSSAGSEAWKKYAQGLAQDRAKAAAEAEDAYRDIRSASAIFRLTVGKDREPISMASLHEWATDQRICVLEYFLTSDDGFLLVVPSGKPTAIYRLNIDDTTAQALDVPAGPLTSEKAAAILLGKVSAFLGIKQPHYGNLIDRLRSDQKDVIEQDILAALYRVLIPEEARATLLDADVRTAAVLPDGPLGFLPWEALIVEKGGDPKYLLDVAPPITYAPSATILQLLANRSRPSTTAKQPVLTVADPAYDKTGVANPQLVSTDNASSGSRYRARGGHLSRLPFSATESKWVAASFSKQGLSAGQLIGKNATEAAVRTYAPGRMILHFACHGFTDPAAKNLFGALALTPGSDATTNTANDGMLTLAEIYELNLENCELAILSACDTNFGPETQGEGAWTLARGFLASGCRRVVASNWLVDDEAAASLVSVYCSRIAKGEKAGSLDYADALHKAKKWARDQERWKSPYYWATFVLVGPN